MSAELNGRSADRVRELCAAIIARPAESALEPLAALILTEFPPAGRITAGMPPLVELCWRHPPDSTIQRCDRRHGHGGVCSWAVPLQAPF